MAGYGLQEVCNIGCRRRVRNSEEKEEVELGLVTLIAVYLLFFLNVVINRTDIANKMLPIIEHHKSV